MNPVATLLQTPDGTLLMDTIDEGPPNTSRGMSDQNDSSAPKGRRPNYGQS